MGQKIDDSIWLPYGFQDTWRNHYTESYRAVIDNSDGFYALRKDLLGYWHGWHFKSLGAMDDTSKTGRTFFGFDLSCNVMHHRMYSHMIMCKMSQFSPEELAVAQKDYQKNFAGNG